MTASEDDERGVPSDAFREGRDVYIIYSWEDVAFHWVQASGRVLRRFKGTRRESETDHSNRLFMDAKMGGRLATREEYDHY
ncbi:hypothetical protein [Caulobacter sp. RL271]|jgi:hypothetical protein|uniref:Uncharacterized protein n=1 Tax=Caulobacter segnis TaxID=88688 RepID=A0ABY4ZU52_9CAUL|nr:hypothetical protein [Caulobacter segnis]USQ96154.1 hypothetical protein MZV50_00665 [Caulobacter segnis]